ncbi:MAG: ammonium transporter [Gordonia sp. (in: high G+C Gram-positive bacteria)]|uniref:ammonium transporter n=1 Tax=Gordonia sp. (in: high G+C Gram-positive bacteria) TaxID=84139 RepID=UPI0039E6859A
MEALLGAHADLSWMLTAFTLIFFMVPGLALYYGGMVGSRNALNMMSMVLVALGISAVLYVIVGYGLVSGPTVGGFIGDPSDYIGLGDTMTDDGSGGVQTLYFAAWFILFAAITVAIVASGAAGRMKFTGWLVFVPVWLLLVYFPVAHWVFAVDADGYEGGFLINDIGIHDYAGGTAVHMNSGVAALALAMALGPRLQRSERPHNVPLALLGGGILWFGWFGFNGSCALGSSFLTQQVLLNTLLAGSAGILGYAVVERWREGSVTSLGLTTGAIGGLVGITPSANSMTPLGALAVGFLAAAAVAFLLSFKHRMHADDSLDAFAVHGLGGIVGTLCVVAFASAAAPAGVEGLLLGGSLNLAWKELAGIVITCTFSFVMTYAIAKVLDKLIGLRVDPDTETAGLDTVVHAENAYEIPAAKA